SVRLPACNQRRRGSEGHGDRWPGPGATSPSRGPSEAHLAGAVPEGLQGACQVFHASDEGAATLPDEELDLKIDDAPFIVGAQAEIAPVPDAELPAREGVADFRGGAAVHVDAIENGDRALG